MIKRTNIEGNFTTYITIEQALKELSQKEIEIVKAGFLIFTIYSIYSL
jgi:hypothetical protein